MPGIRVLIADDQPLFLEGLGTILSMHDPEIEVVGSARNGREAVSLERKLRPDVALLDIIMPEMNGIEAACEMRKNSPSIRIIMLTTFSDRGLVAAALQARANGYILKDAPVPQVVQAIKSVFHGNILISPRVAQQLAEMGDTAELSRQTLEAEELGDLTQREREILLLLASGKTNAEIAEELYISEKTVRNYVSRIYDALGVHNRTQATLWTLEHGLSLSPP